MQKIQTTLSTTAEFSDDGKKRYLLTKVWDKEKPHLAIVMLSPSEASGIGLDTTTMLVINNASRLGYGAISIVNLFATIGNTRECFTEYDDSENLNYITRIAKKSDVIVYAPGVGKATNKSFIARQNQVLDVLIPYEGKLHCLSNKEGNARFQHPLSPAIRYWYLSPMRISELHTETSSASSSEKPIEKKKKNIPK